MRTMIPGTVVTVTRREIKATAEPVREGEVAATDEGLRETRKPEPFVAKEGETAERPTGKPRGSRGAGKPASSNLSKSEQLRELRERNTR